MDFRRTRLHSVSGDLAGLPPPERPEIVVVGRSNVGKSSLVNALGDNRTLARISSLPGKTRLVIIFDVDGVLFLVDLPGYGYAKVAKDKKKDFSRLVEGYLHSTRDLRMAIHIVDIRHEPSPEDQLMRGWLLSRGIRTITVLTKADKLTRMQVLERHAAIRASFALGEEDRTLVFSAENRTGVEELRAILEKEVGLPHI